MKQLCKIIYEHQIPKCNLKLVNKCARACVPIKDRWYTSYYNLLLAQIEARFEHHPFRSTLLTNQKKSYNFDHAFSDLAKIIPGKQVQNHLFQEDFQDENF